MEYQIKIPEEYTLEKVKDKVANGGKFIVYSYCISILLVVTLKRISPAFLILSDDEFQKHKKKYNNLMLVFGWWCIPWGPIITTRYLNTNNSGGIDVTKDIMLNLTPESIETGMIKLERIHTIFSKPEKSELKEFKKAFESLKHTSSINRIIVGLFINTEEYVDSYYVIGIDSSEDFDESRIITETAVYRRFRKHVPFDFIDLTETDDEHDLIGKLIEQGERII